MPRMREEMVLLHSLLAGIHLEIWVQFCKSLIDKLECVLKKVVEIRRAWKPCQMGEQRKELEIFILGKNSIRVINDFKSLKGYCEEKGAVWFCGTPGSQGWG